MTLKSRRVRVPLVVALAVLSVTALGTPVAADGTAGGPLVVALNADGSAEVTLRLTYDLTTEAETAAFESLRNDTAAQEETAAAFRSRMATIADGVAEETGREVAVTDASMHLATDGSTGVVELSATWTNLAAVEDDRLVVREPFAGGYAPDRPFVIVAPDGYVPVETTPEPASVDGTTVRWSPSTDLTGFTAAFAPADAEGTARSDSTPGGTATAGQPGFGVAAALLAVLLTALWLARR